MNNGPGQSQGQPQGQPQGQRPTGQAQAQNLAGRQTPMFQPNQIRSLPTLSDEEKQKYENGLRGLWNKVGSSPQGSAEQTAARQKIIEFSTMLTQKIHQRRQMVQQNRLQQQGQGPGGPGGQPTPQQQQPQQQQQQPQQQQQSQQQQQTMPIQPQQRPPSAQSATQTQTLNPQQQSGGVANDGSAAGANAQSQTQTQGQAQRSRLSEALQAHVNKMTWRAPPPIMQKGPAAVQKWVDEIKDHYGRALTQMESTRKQVQLIGEFLKDKEAAGTLSDEEKKQRIAQRDTHIKAHAEAKGYVEKIRNQQVVLDPNRQKSAAQPQQNAQQSNTATVQGVGAANTAQPGNPAVEANRRNSQINPTNAASPSNGGVTAPQPSQQQQQRPPLAVQQPAQQSQPVANQQQQSQTQQQTSQNPQVAAVQNQNQAGPVQSRGNTPQSATPVTATGPTRALSHSAAMSLANQRAAITPGGATQTQQGATTTTPQSAGAASSGMSNPTQSQQGHSHAHPSQHQTTLQPTAPAPSRMPIPKQLPEKATAVPVGVTVGGGVNTGRPTMSQGSGTIGGVMNQPAMSRIPAYSHEAEGDHVLSKKKLDELVRQVCGGPADGQDGNLLSPEVEESVINMADTFVDSVLHAACRNSKERGSKVLEIRDIQLILERTYNIRVPGYSSDELRTVRKIQPSPGWIAKMSAVQAAKVMPGKGE